MTLLQSMASVISKINTHQDFYRKICQVFTTYITQALPAFHLHGYTITPVESWKNFTEEEFSAMVNINGPIELTREPMQLYPREEKWYQAKL